MDLINQNKFKNGLIIVLLVVNLLTVSIIWMQTAKKNESKPNEQGGPRAESVNLMKEVLSLNDKQTEEFEKIRITKLGEAKRYNDSLNLLKKQLAEELFKEKPDSANAKNKSEEIGEMQTKVEMVRFKHFKELMKICTPEQKEKLKPIMIEIFGKKPPKEEPMAAKPDERLKEEKEKPNGEFRKENKESDNQLRDEKRRRNQNDLDPARRDEKQPPPTMEEKVARLTERLNLTIEQVEKIKSVLIAGKQRGEKLRMRNNSDPNEAEIERERVKKEEDERIMKILNDDQKREFSKMIIKRRK